MFKNLYCIYDNVSKDFGEVLSLSNDVEAKRAFTHACLQTGFQDDLSLVKLGTIGISKMYVKDSEPDKAGLNFDVPTILQAGSTVLYSFSDVENDVKELRQKRYEDTVLYNKINSEYSAKEFTENVQKLARYFSKKDKKRFN